MQFSARGEVARAESYQKDTFCQIKTAYSIFFGSYILTYIFLFVIRGDAFLISSIYCFFRRKYYCFSENDLQIYISNENSNSNPPCASLDTLKRHQELCHKTMRFSLQCPSRKRVPKNLRNITTR